MFEAPLHEIASPQEQLAVARCVAILAAGGGKVADAQRRFVEKLMAKMMLLPEERDLVRREFEAPSDIFAVAQTVQHREARIFLLYQAICGAFAGNDLHEAEFALVLELAQSFSFELEAARSFVYWVRDSLELSARGQRLLVEL